MWKIRTLEVQVSKWTEKDTRTRDPNTYNRGGKWRKVNEAGTDEDPHCDEVGVVTVVLQTPSHRE